MSDLGELLRQARVYKGASLRDAERATRISRTYLEALESEDFAQLPPPAYARGIVKNYAQYLGLDPVAILALYDSSDDESVGEAIQVVPATRSMDVPSHWAPNFAIIGFMLVVSAIVFTWLYSAYFQSEFVDPNLASGFPTVTPISDSLLSTVILTPVPSPEAQAGGQEVPQESPTEAPTVTPIPTEPPAPPTATPEPVSEAVVVDETDDEVDGSAAFAEDDVVVPGGAYEIVLVATEEVWIEVSLDWNTVPDYEATLQEGESVRFVADVATISSGNAGYVEVYVDGTSWGILSSTWNETVTLP
jgi:cytoskeletal protein RodZ